MLRTTLAAAALALLAGTAAAHIVVEPKETPVGASYRATFRVTHGCDEAPTTAIRIRIPEGVIGVKPMPKPGWQLKIERGAYKKPYAYYHGKTLAEGAIEITWSGGELPNDHVDEFTLIGFVAGELKANQTLYFPIVQDCAGGKSTEWTEIAKDARDHPERPAPGVRLMLKPMERPH